MTSERDSPVEQPVVPRRTLWAWTLATWFGAGFLKPGPGTYGAAAATLLWYAAARGFHWSQGASIAFTAVAAVSATVVGIPAASISARESGIEDPGFVVIDEVAGQWFTLLFARPEWKHAGLCFVLFRIFDITKPWPIRKLESLPAGTGIMSDDVAAGLLGLLVYLVVSPWI